jgi:hypothetical protein
VLAWRKLRNHIGRLGGRIFTRARRAEAALGDGTRVQCLLVGGHLFSEYLLSLPCFAGSPVSRSRMRIDAIGARGEPSSASVDLCIAALPIEYPLPVGSWRFRQQEFVRQVIDLSPTAPPNRRLASKMKETQRRIRRYGLTSEVSRDAADFAFFYERMFLPHTRTQFGAHADIESQEEMQTYFRRGFVVFVAKDGVRLVGSLCFVQDGVLVYRRSGVLDGDRAHLSTGAQAAGYYYFLTLAQEMGCGAVDLMNSRPFPSDGVYRFKRDWGASVQAEDRPERGVFHLHLGDRRGLVRFYAENPAIVLLDEGLAVVVGIPGGGDVDAAALYERFYSPGLGGALVLRDPPAPPVRIPFAGDGVNERG